MIENSRPTRLAIIAFFLVFWTSIFCPVSLAEPAKTLIRNAALLITMDSSLGASDLGTRVGADVLIEHDKMSSGPTLLRRTSSVAIFRH